MLTAHSLSGGGGGGSVFCLLARQLDNALGCERLEPQPLGLEVGLLAGSDELSDVELLTHGYRGETAAALALEVVDDGGVTQNRRRAARGSGDGGGRRRVGVADLDVVRRQTVLRRDETEPPRARPCVGGSPAALSGASTASQSTALAAAELLGSLTVRERCELRVVNDSRACQRKRSISAWCGAKKHSPRWRRRTQRSTSASWRFLFKLSRRCIVKRQPRPLVLAAQPRSHRGEFDLELQSWSMSGVALLPLGRQLPPEALESLHGPLVEADVDGVHARAGSARRGSSAPAR